MLDVYKLCVRPGKGAQIAQNAAGALSLAASDSFIYLFIFLDEGFQFLNLLFICYFFFVLFSSFSPPAF